MISDTTSCIAHCLTCRKAKTWSQTMKDKKKRPYKKTPSSWDYLDDWMVWKPPRWEKSPYFWVALTIWLTLVGVSLIFQKWYVLVPLLSFSFFHWFARQHSHNNNYSWFLEHSWPAVSIDLVEIVSFKIPVPNFVLFFTVCQDVKCTMRLRCCFTTVECNYLRQHRVNVLKRDLKDKKCITRWFQEHSYGQCKQALWIRWSSFWRPWSWIYSQKTCTSWLGSIHLGKIWGLVSQVGIINFCLQFHVTCRSIAWIVATYSDWDGHLRAFWFYITSQLKCWKV